MKVMGVDLSSYSIAIAVIGPEMPSLIKHGIHEKHRKDRNYVANYLYGFASSVVDAYQPEAIFIEEPVVAGAMNMRSSLLIAQVCGVMLVAAGMGRVVKLIPVSTWKKETVGSGSANKVAVRLWLDNKHPEVASECRHDQDLYDAACVAFYGQGLLQRSDDLRSVFHDGA